MSYGVNLHNRYPNPTPKGDGTGTFVPGQALAVAAAPVQLFQTVAINVNTLLVLIDVQTAGVYVTFGGEVPAAGSGHLLAAGTQYWLSCAAANKARFIQAVGAATIYASEWTL